MCDTIEAYKKGYRADNGTVVFLKTMNVRVLDLHRTGHPRFGFRDSRNRLRHCMAHRLAAYQKYGKKALRHGVVVRHKNDNPEDFSPENILIGSQAMNMRDRWRNYRRDQLCSA